MGFDVCILFGGVRYCLDNASTWRGHGWSPRDTCNFGRGTSLSTVTNYCAINDTQGAVYSCLCIQLLSRVYLVLRRGERDREGLLFFIQRT